MGIQWTVGKKLAAGFGLALLLLAIVGGVAYRSLSLVIDNAAQVEHTHVMVENLEAILSLLKDTETGQRGFLLTRRSSYLEPYEKAKTSVPLRMKELRRLTADSPNQLRRLDDLEPLITKKLDELQETIDLRKRDEEKETVDLKKSPGLEAALVIVLKDSGKKTMDDIRKVVGDMEDDERHQLEKRTQEEEDSVRTAKWTIIIVSTLAVLALSMISYLLTLGITRPLRQVMDRSEKIAAGNLEGEKLRVASSDELGQLGRSFNTMLEGLQALTRQTITVTTNLNTATAEILASTQEQAASARQQATTVQQITTTMEEVSQSGAQISSKAKQVATAAEATSAASNSGMQAVQETTRTMAAIREQVEEVAENIVALSEKTQAVGEIIATVNDIAERSNLLALNAAIEAASAGEHGNRFSVVASEMKNLADQAKDSTVQVRTILSDIQKGINSSVMLTEEAVKRVETGKQQADLTEQTIRQTSSTTLECIQAFEQIIGAGNQQQIGFEQVAQGMKDIRQAASQSAAATGQLDKAVANLNGLSLELKQTVGRYRI